jgi:hypothetical protein
MTSAEQIENLAQQIHVEMSKARPGHQPAPWDMIGETMRHSYRVMAMKRIDEQTTANNERPE